MSQEDEFDGDLDAVEVLSQLDDLEAEMMSTLDEEDFDWDELNDESGLYENDFDGAEFGNELRLMREDDRKTPVGDEPKTPTAEDTFFANNDSAESSEETGDSEDLNNGLDEGVDVTPTKVNGSSSPAVNGDSIYKNSVRQEQMRRKSQM